MKHVPLHTLESTDGGPAIDYATVLREVVKRPLNPREGATIDEMRQGIRLLDALDSANGTLDLEDSDYANLKAKLLAMPWNLIDRRLVQLVDDVLGA